MALTVKDCLKLSATGLSGLFAGCALYINAAGHPATLKVDVINRRKVWMDGFHRAKKFQGIMAGLGALAGATVYYLDEESDNRLLWLVGAGVFISVWPWTLIVMIPDINKNLQDDVLETAGETWVKNHMDRWNKQHAVRTVMSSVAFGIFMYALLKK